MPNTPRSIAAEAISTAHTNGHEGASDNCMAADTRDAASLFEMPASKRLRPMDAMEATPLLSDDLFEGVIEDLSTSEAPSYEMPSSDAISDELFGHFQPYSPSLTNTDAYPLSPALANSPLPFSLNPIPFAPMAQADASYGNTAPSALSTSPEGAACSFDSPPVSNALPLSAQPIAPESSQLEFIDFSSLMDEECPSLENPGANHPAYIAPPLMQHCLLDKTDCE